MTGKAHAGQEINYIYDVEDRLVKVESGSSTVIAEYYYDPFGRRLWKDVDGVRTNFVYSDEGLVGEYDASGAELRTYGWAPASHWGTDPFFVKIGSQYYWYQNDHQGTPQKLITSSGLVVWSATYDSFGNAQIGIEGITNNLRFPGQYYDAETGLHYNLNRYYDPATGRYLRTDPYGDGLNLYAYVFNNPTSLIDPSGLCVARIPGAIADWWTQSSSQTREILRSWIDEDPNWWAVAASIETAMDLGEGFVDVLRFGRGIAQGNWRGLGADSIRALTVLPPLGRGAKWLGSLSGTLPRTLSALAGLARKSIQFGHLPPNVFGATDWFGNITIQRGLTGRLLRETLRHERVHSLLSPVYSPIVGETRAALRRIGYQRSHLLQYIEEAAAEIYATKSFQRGLWFPIREGYVKMTRVTLEAATAFTTYAGALYGAYSLSTE